MVGSAVAEAAMLVVPSPSEAEMTVNQGDTGTDRRCADVANRGETYAALSHSYAADGDLRLAVLATWADDVQMLESLLWESGLASAPDPGAQLRLVAEAVVASLADGPAVPASVSPVTARSLVEDARTAMTAAFDASVHALLAERFMSLDHLDAEFPKAVLSGPGRATRLDGRSVTELIEDLRVTAGDCIAVARIMSAAGRTQDAWHQVRASDTAAFEAYLLDAAVISGDAGLASVDLRWDLGVAVIGDLPQDPQDLDGAVAQCRERLAGIVGLAETGALLAAFEQFTPAPA
jgi:hypothetical protein